MHFAKNQLKRELKRFGKRGNCCHRPSVQHSGRDLQRLDNTMSAATVKRKPKSAVSHSNSNNVSGMSTTQNVLKEKAREKEREERKKLVLWRRPIRTLEYFIREALLQLNFCAHALFSFVYELLHCRKAVSLLLLVISASIIFFNVGGPHQQYIRWLRSYSTLCLYWMWLGVLSSVGLGTGLHTFLLHLGPHIASVTLAAYECGSLNFPEPPYPDEILCPETVDPHWQASILNIMSKVRLEAMMWGAGTALGELPPYFMARAARLSGYDPNDEESLREFAELQHKKDNPQLMTSMDRLMLFVERLVERVGFFGILACASIPNPLFDLAGITCGHFLVPFWTFFGATLIGKAIIKIQIQKIFVIIAFNETLVERAIDLMEYIPYIGYQLQQPFRAFLVKQKMKLYRRADVDAGSESNLLAKVFALFAATMILCCIVSTVNAFAQKHHKRLHESGNIKKAKH